LEAWRSKHDAYAGTGNVRPAPPEGDAGRGHRARTLCAEDRPVPSSEGAFDPSPKGQFATNPHKVEAFDHVAQALVPPKQRRRRRRERASHRVFACAERARRHIHRSRNRLEQMETSNPDHSRS